MAVAPEGSAPPTFLWGGRSWSAGDLSAFKHWLAAHGTSYAQWASNHADTAKAVFGRSPQVTDNTPGAGAASGAAGSTDLTDAINSDPIFSGLRNSLSAQGVSDAASRAAAIKQMLIDFGSVPDIDKVANQLGLNPSDLAMLRGDITPDIANLAGQNTNEGLSVVARLEQARKQAQENLMNQLGASGLFHSGATGYQLGQQALAAKQNYSDALSKLLAALGGTIGNYDAAQRNIAGQLGAGASDAAARFLQTHPYASSAPPAAAGVPSAPKPTYVAPTRASRLLVQQTKPLTYGGLDV